MEVEAKAVSFVVLPLPLVDVAVLMQQSTVVVGLVLVPVALIEATVGPDLYTSSLAHWLVFEPLTDIARPVLQAHQRPMLALSIVLETKVSLILSHLIDERPVSLQHFLDGLGQAKKQRMSTNAMNESELFIKCHHLSRGTIRCGSVH